MKTLKPKDFEGKYDLNVDIKNTVSYEYFFKEIKGVVYKFYRIDKGEWEVQETPFKEIPFNYYE